MTPAQTLVEACQEMNRLGINQGRAGNISLRAGSAMLISPSAIPYDAMRADMVATMQLDAADGAWTGPCRPSTEWRFHRDILRARRDFGAVVHAHPPWCTALAIGRRGIPACHYMIVLFGGADVRCAAYADFGTEALSQAVLAAMEGRSACLMANHGAVVAAADLPTALQRMVELEALARQYLLAAQAGEVCLLTDPELQAAARSFETYA